MPVQSASARLRQPGPAAEAARMPRQIPIRRPPATPVPRSRRRPSSPGRPLPWESQAGIERSGVAATAANEPGTRPVAARTVAVIDKRHGTPPLRRRPDGAGCRDYQSSVNRQQKPVRACGMVACPTTHLALRRVGTTQTPAPADQTPRHSASPHAGHAIPAASSSASPPDLPQRPAQHLPPLAERRRRQPLHPREQRRLRLHRARRQHHHRGPHLRRRHERGGRDAQSPASPRRSTAPAPTAVHTRRSRSSTDPLGHLELEHQHQPLERRRLAQPAHQQRRRDIVRQVRHDHPGRRHQRTPDPSPSHPPPPRAAATAQFPPAHPSPPRRADRPRSPSPTPRRSPATRASARRGPARPRSPAARPDRPQGARSARSGSHRAKSAGPATGGHPARACAMTSRSFGGHCVAFRHARPIHGGPAHPRIIQPSARSSPA
jgi:hypothetical protein